MALNPGDPSYLAEVTPDSITALGAGLRRAYGVGSGNFGSKGNDVHLSGYHRSRRWILNSPDSAHGIGDYSVTQPADKLGDPNWISAFDFTPGVWGSPDNRTKMKVITARMLEAARRNDPRLANLREVAGTLDGTHVVTFYAQGGAFKSPFDSSHLDHMHGSFWRKSAASDHSGILAVMLGEDEMSDQAESILAALANGSRNYTGSDGKSHEFVPVTEIYREIDFRATVLAKLDALATQTVALTAADVQNIANTVAAAVAANGANPLGDNDIPMVADAVAAELSRRLGVQA